MMNGAGDTPAAAVTRAVVGIWASAFGKGPDVARTYFNDENVVVVMHGGLLPHEQRLVDAGHEDAVRAGRHRFERVMAPELTGAVENVLGRRVATFDSQVLFRPTRTFELFVLESAS